MRIRAVVLVVSLAVAVPAGGAWAHGAGGETVLPADAEPVAPEGKKAKEVLAALPGDEASRALVAESVKKAKLALGRAHGAKLAGDAEGAGLLSRVALAWAQTAAGTLRAVETEKKAAATETKARELKEKIARAKALLTESEARKLKLNADVAKEEAKKPPAKATKGGAASKEKAKKPPPKGEGKAAPPDSKKPQPKPEKGAKP